MSVVRGDPWPWLPAYAVARREPGFASTLWLIPLAGALLAPLVTWLPMLAIKFRGGANALGQTTAIGLPLYDPRMGIDTWHMQALWAVVFGIIALLVGRTDRWLGAAVAYVGAWLFLWGGTVNVTHYVVFAFGAVILWSVRQAPREWHPMVRTMLAASGVFQAAYIFQQLMGYDVLWGPLVGGVLVPNLRPIGTLGTVDAATAYVAITAPLMPFWALPVAIYVVLKGHSIGAICALTVGLLIRFYRGLAQRQAIGSRTPAYATAAVALTVLGIWYAFYCPPHVPSTVSGRVGIWTFALVDWWQTHPLFGPGPWAQHIPLAQFQAKFLPNGEAYLEAHNEYLQWLYEAGAVGFLILAGWAWRHRRAFFAGVTAPCLWALAINAGSFFVFHVVSVALVGIILVGLATSDHPQEVA